MILIYYYILYLSLIVKISLEFIFNIEINIKTVLHSLMFINPLFFYESHLKIMN